MRNLSEAVNRIRLDKFKEHCPEIFSSVENVIPDIWEALKAEDESNKGNLCRESWNAIKKHVDKYKFIKKFSVFNDSMGKNGELWRYLSMFLDKIMPVVINLTQSFRDGDWELYLSAIRRAMTLVFVFGRINYCRWFPLYYEHYMKLKTNFPILHEASIEVTLCCNIQGVKIVEYPWTL